MATVTHPPGDVSSMDGYAIGPGDAPEGGWPLRGESAAGSMPTPLQRGHATRIFTGALLPQGADRVVRQEVATVEGSRVTLPSVRTGMFVRPQGEVFAAGDVVAGSGDIINPVRLALLVASGVAQVDVTPRPRIRVLVTGTELVASDQPTRDGEIFDSNGPMLSALLESASEGSVDAARVGDDAAETGRALANAAAHADLVVTSGGVSVGDHDHVPQALRSLGADVLFHRIKVKPGKPILVARVGTTWVVGLPGNPVSALVGWRMFALPLAHALAGDLDAFAEPERLAQLDAPVHNDGDRVTLRPGILQGGVVTLARWKGSHDLIGAAQANVLVRIEPGARHDTDDRVPWINMYPHEES